MDVCKMQTYSECIGENGQACKFPFIYQGQTFDECTKYDTNNGEPWCATAVDANGGTTTWSNCILDSCPADNSTEPECVATNSLPCKFPFFYKGNTYEACTVFDDNKNTPWCATSVDSNGVMKTWEHCNMENCKTECTTTAGDKCDFPFTLNGVEHTKCTLAESTDGKPWCSIGNLVELDSRSMIKGICDLNACEVEDCTECVTDKGIPCVFPFTYKEVTYNNCTLVDDVGGRPWCSTQVNSEGEYTGQWGNCDMDCQLCRDAGEATTTSSNESTTSSEENSNSSESTSSSGASTEATSDSTNNSESTTFSLYYPFGAPLRAYPYPPMGAPSTQPLQRGVSLVNFENFLQINGAFATDDTTTPAQVVTGSYMFQQNGIFDLVTGNNAKYQVYVNGNSLDLANKNVKLALASDCATAGTAVLTTVTAPFILINGFWISGTATGYNIDGSNSMTSIRGMRLQVLDADGNIIGCSGAVLN